MIAFYVQVSNYYWLNIFLAKSHKYVTNDKLVIPNWRIEIFNLIYCNKKFSDKKLSAPTHSQWYYWIHLVHSIQLSIH